ncbi:PQQ-binding-like beta-propeller repeat protein [Luteolibacter marinus]|uniref:PQQ-binding-like beta-propeller repeat protein n=1 Tax=Luteolibacter marinus TaxID=2776705 RepID=UPI0018662B24|nr:PQQ-binding-like beta-propeller repeat protein [Luteolibacter marinus]
MNRIPLLSAALLLPVVSHAQDWPRYLGPDGAAKIEGTLRTDWKDNAPKELWRKQLGQGCTSFAISGNKVVVMGNKDNTDIVWCFDTATGDEVWTYKYPEKLDPKLYDGGPNCTPTIDGDVVYTLSRTGNLFCLAMADGQPKWHKHYQTDFKGKAPSWGYSASPLVQGDLLYCLPCAKDGGVYALDKATGEVRWKSGDSTKPGYAAPVFFDYKGKPALAAFHGRELVAYDLSAEGKPLFDFTWRTSYDINASNPQYHDGMMFLASGYGMGYTVIDVAGGKPTVLHKEEDTRMIFQNSILVDGDIVGVFGDKNIDAELIRMDMRSGDIRWKERMPGTRGSSLMVGDTLVILAETGEIICGEPAKDGWTEHGRVKALSPLCWAPVAFGDGKIFARSNKGEAVCLDVK